MFLGRRAYVIVMRHEIHAWLFLQNPSEGDVIKCVDDTVEKSFG